MHHSTDRMAPTTAFGIPVVEHWLEQEITQRVHYEGSSCVVEGARCSSVVRAFTHGAMGRRIDPSWRGPIELFLIPASAPRLV